MQKKSLIFLAAAALAGAALVAVVFVAGDGEQGAPLPQIGELAAERRSPMPSEDQFEVEPAPDFSVETLDGDSLQLSSLAGNVVVLNFWATWCAPCRIEIPDLIELQAELGDEGVQVVGISLDHDGREVVQAFADEVDFNYPIVLDDGDIATEFGGIYALPTTIIIDREGMMRRRIPGLVTKKLLTPLLRDLANG